MALRAAFVLVSLIVAPILGVVAGSSMPNPPGNGPGVWQVVVGIAIPVFLTLAAAWIARVAGKRAFVVAVLSVAETGALVLMIVWFVGAHLS